MVPPKAKYNLTIPSVISEFYVCDGDIIRKNKTSKDFYPPGYPTLYFTFRSLKDQFALYYLYSTSILQMKNRSK